MLPNDFVKFWYFESFGFFLRVLENTVLYIEEDLAVGLMVKLLFVPLFHDSSIVGRILSFFFRLFRILIGLFAFSLAVIFILFLALVWFVTPPLALISFYSQFYPLPFFGQNLKGLSDIAPVFVLGLALFLYRWLSAPDKKVWQVKTSGNIWLASTIGRLNANWNFLQKTPEVLEYLSLLEKTPSDFTKEVNILDEDLLAKVLTLAEKSNARYISAPYFWLAFAEKTYTEEDLLKMNLTLDDFETALFFWQFKKNSLRKIMLWDEEFQIKHLKGINRGWLGAPTPSLDAVSVDLTREAALGKIPDFIGRSSAVSDTINILSQARDRNVLLVGEPGSGRSTLIKYLAKLIIQGNAPEALATKRLVELDLPKLLTGVSTEGDLAKKIKEAFDEIKFVEDIIVYIDEIHEMGLGDAGRNLNIFALLLPYLESESFQFLASTETGNYAKFIEKNGSFARIFHKVELLPASLGETRKILMQRAADLWQEKGINLSLPALNEIAQKADKYIHDRCLPDSALSVLTECEVLAKVGWIKKTTVDEALSKNVNVPLSETNGVQKKLLLDLEEVIHKDLIDQEEAVKAIADTLRRSVTSLREENRPIGSFLFVGPTGVGKTELAKILSKVYFGAKQPQNIHSGSEPDKKESDNFIRFDMSEYQTEEAVNRLLGTESFPGELTEAVKNKPYCLILLDEFEKASPKILTLFLQVFDDGRLTDASGKTVDFTSTIIIATSNVGSLLIAQGLTLGKQIDDLKISVKEELLKSFKPELVNRFDEIVLFKTLSTQDLEKIVMIKLKALKNILHDQGYLIEFSPELVADLTRKGFDPVLGARPLRRLIQDTLEAKLSKMILEEKLEKGKIFNAGLELIT